MCFEIEIKEPGCPVLIVWRNYASKEFEVTCLYTLILRADLIFIFFHLFLCVLSMCYFNLLDNNAVMVSCLIVCRTLFMLKKTKKG